MSFLRLAVVLAVLLSGGLAALATVDDPMVDCLSDDNQRRIKGCSAMIDTPGLPEDQRSLAYGMRALAYSLLGMFDKAIHDYDVALEVRPDFPLALNNRAWAYFKLGRAEQGIADVERALALSPGSPYALDTRAHIRQAQGEAEAAFRDYDLAMRAGGERIVKMYQCGLRSQGLYFGALDGLYSTGLSEAMKTCTGNRQCDPLPSDSECRPEVS
ncbi:Tetratricopeptide repeat protein [Hyphomicrobium sp. 1Nfss2.1]|uniref:tetratricopeptide repeat protein n=1 Tax=Hyphomicrobium sp. 1Nfss2.1 TaxID=3413936 RepID=UPI003C7AFA90